MRKKYLPAYTLTEVLVVMIITGIIFISLFDAMDVVQKYGKKFTEKLTKGAEMLDGFQRLEQLYLRADSICEAEKGFVFFGQGQEYAVLVYKDSLLTVLQATQTDTLFRQVGSLITVTDSLASGHIDSLYFTLRLQQTSLVLSFGLPIH